MLLWHGQCAESVQGTDGCSPASTEEKLFGPQIIVRSLSEATVEDKAGNLWQYHSRSDHHSKVGCWAIMFDLLQTCSLLARHVVEGRVAFGINHTMRDFRNNRKKNLDLVLCTPAKNAAVADARDFAALIDHYHVLLTADERRAFENLPRLAACPVGAVLMALEAKACMTAHQRALPRLYDELNSSHLTVHGATDEAIAAGFVMVNTATEFLSPDLNKSSLKSSEPRYSRHNQPRDAELAIGKVKEISRRSRTGEAGFDALGIIMIDCRNDGSAINLVEGPPAPAPGDIFNYTSLIDRLSHIYSTRFVHL